MLGTAPLHRSGSCDTTDLGRGAVVVDALVDGVTRAGSSTATTVGELLPRDTANTTAMPTASARATAMTPMRTAFPLLAGDAPGDGGGVGLVHSADGSGR